MSTSLFTVDHHATFQGWSTDNAEAQSKASDWSSRRSVGFIVASALASWILLLTPFVLIGS
jgi:hypothetical protein